MTMFLYTYDFAETSPPPYAVFVQEALEHDLTYVYSKSGVVLRLPQTTLWSDRPDLTDSVGAFHAALADASRRLGRAVVIEKLAIVPFVGGQFDSDRRKVPERRLVGRTKLETCVAHQRHDPFFIY